MQKYLKNIQRTGHLQFSPVWPASLSAGWKHDVAHQCGTHKNRGSVVTQHPSVIIAGPSLSHQDQSEQQHRGLSVNVLCIWLPTDGRVQLEAGTLRYHFTASHQNQLPGVGGWCSSSQQECSGCNSATFSLVDHVKWRTKTRQSVSLGFSQGCFVFQIWQPIFSSLCR